MKYQPEDLSRNSCVCSNSLYFAVCVVVEIHISIEGDRNRNEVPNTERLQPISKCYSTKERRD